MGSPALVVTPDEGFVGGFDEQNLEVHIFVPFKGSNAGLKVPEKAAAPHIDYECRFFYVFLSGKAKVYEISDESRRHIIDTVVPLVLEPVRRLGLSRPGKSRNNYNFHVAPPLFKYFFKFGYVHFFPGVSLRQGFLYPVEHLFCEV